MQLILLDKYFRFHVMQLHLYRRLRTLGYTIDEAANKSGIKASGNFSAEANLWIQIAEDFFQTAGALTEPDDSESDDYRFGYISGLTTATRNILSETVSNSEDDEIQSLLTLVDEIDNIYKFLGYEGNEIDE